MTRSRTAAAALLLATLLTGCTQGPDAFNENFPADDPETDVRLVPRLPEAPSQGDGVDSPLLPTRDPEPPVASQEDAGRSD